MEEELNQTKDTCNELEERLESALAKMQHTLENELCLASTRDQELLKKRERLESRSPCLRTHPATEFPNKRKFPNHDLKQEIFIF